jgi:hypothetical protein
MEMDIKSDGAHLLLGSLGRSSAHYIAIILAH